MILVDLTSLFYDRALTVTALYPVLCSVGYTLNWRQCVVLIWANFKGAVMMGISLSRWQNNINVDLAFKVHHVLELCVYGKWFNGSTEITCFTCPCLTTYSKRKQPISRTLSNRLSLKLRARPLLFSYVYWQRRSKHKVTWGSRTSSIWKKTEKLRVKVLGPQTEKVHRVLHGETMQHVVRNLHATCTAERDITFGVYCVTNRYKTLFFNLTYVKHAGGSRSPRRSVSGASHQLIDSANIDQKPWYD